MADAAVKPKPADTAAEHPERELTDGFHLVIDALKLNGITTIYNVPGIPITDLGRMAQAAGLRVISFRHEQNAGNAAAIAGFLACHVLTCRFLVQEGVVDKDRFTAYLETAMAGMAPGIEDKRTLFSLRQLITALRAPPASTAMQ